MEAANFENPTSPREVIDLINNHHKAGYPFSNLLRLEAGGARLFADQERVREWETWPNQSAKHIEIIESIEKMEEIIQPLVGSKIAGGANQTCSLSEQGVWQEETHEYSPKWSNGKLLGVQAMVVELTDNYPKEFGDDIPGRYPKEGTFEHYRICLDIGKVCLPISQFNGGWNKLVLAQKANLL